MICPKTFVQKYKQDFQTWQEWLDFVNENYQYCIKESKVWDWKGKCRAGDLSSHHPYWDHEILKEYENILDKLEKNYTECQKDSGKIKYIFNAGTRIEDIEKMISIRKDKINQYRNKLENKY